MVETCPDNFYDLIWWYRRNPFRTMRGCTMVEKINKCRIEWIRLFGSYLMVVEKQLSQELKIDFIAFLWHKLKMILFRNFLCPLCSINLCVRPLMDSTNKKCGPIFFAFYSRYSSRWSRLDSRLLGTMLEFLLWLIVHKNDEFVGKVKPSRVLTSATLILIVLDAEQRKSWYLSSWRSFRASWFFFMGSSSSSEYDLWFLLYFKQQPRWPCVFSTDP